MHAVGKVLYMINEQAERNHPLHYCAMAITVYPA
jgi:hypothetical protein